METPRSASGSIAEDLFIQLFSEVFGAEKAGYLYSQYHFYDIYQNSRYADFVLENNGRRVAIEIDDEGSHHKSLVASGKFYDDLLKQNSMVYLGWDVYRWAVSTAFNIFVRQALREGRISFDISLNYPNERTIAAMLEAERIAKDPSVKGYTDLDELFADLKA